jgi:hypothetical protein
MKNDDSAQPKQPMFISAPTNRHELRKQKASCGLIPYVITAACAAENEEAEVERLVGHPPDIVDAPESAPRMPKALSWFVESETEVERLLIIIDNAGVEAGCLSPHGRRRIMAPFATVRSGLSDLRPSMETPSPADGLARGETCGGHRLLGWAPAKYTSCQVLA